MTLTLLPCCFSLAFSSPKLFSIYTFIFSLHYSMIVVAAGFPTRLPSPWGQRLSCHCNALQCLAQCPYKFSINVILNSTEIYFCLSSAGKRSTQQLDPSPARKLLKLQPQNPPATHCSRSCQWLHVPFLPQGAPKKRDGTSAPVHGNWMAVWAGDSCPVAFEDWLNVEPCSFFFLKVTEFMHL